MKFATVRSAMFQVHMWVGLILGVLLVLVSLSGSILVYDDKLAEMFNPAPKATTAGQRSAADLHRRSGARGRGRCGERPGPNRAAAKPARSRHRAFHASAA